MAEKLEYTHVVAVQLPNDNDNLLGNQKWSKNKIDVYYGQAGLNIPIQNGVFVDTNEINRDFISKAIYYLYNKRTAVGKEDFEVEKKEIFGEGNRDDVLFMGMKKVNKIYTGHIVKKIATNKMGLYSFEYHPKIKNVFRSPIQNLSLVEQLTAETVQTAKLATDKLANDAALTAAAAKAAEDAAAAEDAKKTILELLSEITKTSSSSINPAASNSKGGGKRNSKGNRKTQKKRKTQPKKKPKKKSLRKTSKK